MDPLPKQPSVADFVERFAAGMVAAGMPRMPARVFASLLSRDDGSATASELSGALQASPAAISGAVRYLIQLRVITRVPPTRRAATSTAWCPTTGTR